MEVPFKSQQRGRRNEAKIQGRKLLLGKKDRSDVDISLDGRDSEQLEVRRWHSPCHSCWFSNERGYRLGRRQVSLTCRSLIPRALLSRYASKDLRTYQCLLGTGTGSQVCFFFLFFFFTPSDLQPKS